MEGHMIYRQTSNIRKILVGNKINDHSGLIVPSEITGSIEMRNSIKIGEMRGSIVR